MIFYENPIRSKRGRHFWCRELPVEGHEEPRKITKIFKFGIVRVCYEKIFRAANEESYFSIKMKLFLKRILLYLVPAVVLVLPPFLILYLSGESFHSVDEVYRNKGLVGYAYTSKNYETIKWHRVYKDDPYEVLTLGSSRTLMFESKMFNTTFYNAGYTVRRIEDFMVFLSSIPNEKLPKHLLLGLDQWMFNKAWFEGVKIQTVHAYERKFSNRPSFSNFQKVYEDLLRGKIDPSLIFKDGSLIGLNAKMNRKGLRPDGSMEYGDLESDDNFSSGFSKTINSIERGSGRFKYAEDISQVALDSLISLLTFCKRNQIEVVAFLPPFPSKVLSAFKKGNHEYIWKINNELTPIFNQFNYEIFDFTDMSELNVSDSMYIDGFHGDTEAYLMILKEMKRAKGEIAKFIE